MSKVGLALLLVLLTATSVAARTATPAEIGQARALAGAALNAQTSNAAFVGFVTQLKRTGTSNIMEVVYLVMKQAIEESNADKAYYLSKLQSYNQLQQDLADYLNDLNNATNKLGSKLSGQDDPLSDYAAAVAALERILAARRNLSPNDRNALQALADKDRRFLASARRLIDMSKVIAQSPPSPGPTTLGGQGNQAIRRPP